MAFSFISWFLFALCISIPVSEASLAAMSFDLGSQYLKFGLVKAGIPMEIVLNKESQRKTPALIGFNNGERVFGESALQLSYKHPERVIQGITTLIGKNIDNPLVQAWIAEFPYHTLTVSQDERTTSPRPSLVITTKAGDSYPVEVLLAMIISNARDQVAAFAKQPVSNVVISVPAYYTQAERQSIWLAAQSAKLNVLQFISDGSAAALSYAFTRRNDITETVQNVLIYDVGASKITATVVELSLAKGKTAKDTFPLIKVIGVGFDRGFGGHVLTRHLRDYLADQFTKTHKTSQPITKNLRAMAKLLKESERVKHVLSANTKTYAQVESLFEDQDFRQEVNREVVNDLVSATQATWLKPIEDALRMAEIGIGNVDQIVLFGAGTRLPLLQDIIREFFKGKEANRFLNTDEAVALGAVYQAAHVSAGFKVKRIDVLELVLYPVALSYEQINEETKETRAVSRVLFPYKSHYPTNRKIITFTPEGPVLQKDPFVAQLHYGKLNLSPRQIEEFGEASTNLTSVVFSGVKEQVEKNAAKGTHEFKFVKAYFVIDSFGRAQSDGADIFFESPEVKKNSTIEAIVDSIGNFFSSGNTAEEDKEATSEESVPTPETPEPEPPAAEPETTTQAPDASDSAKDKDTTTPPPTTEDAKAPKETKPSGNATAEEPAAKKPRVVKNKLKIKHENDVTEVSDVELTEIRRVLEKFDSAERAKAQRDVAHNELEALVYDIQDKLTNPEFTDYGRGNEVENLTDIVHAASQWLEDEVGPDTGIEELLARKEGIDSIVNVITRRRKDLNERPILTKRLTDALNETDSFRQTLQTLHNETLGESFFSRLIKIVEEVKTFSEERLPGTEDDLTLNVDLIKQIERLERATTEFATKTARKLKQLELAAKKAALEAAKAKNETETETTDAKQNQTTTEGSAEATPDTDGTNTADTPNTSENAADQDQKAHEEF